MNGQLRENGAWAGIAGLVMLLYSWMTGGWAVPSSAGRFLELTLDAVDWALPIGGFALLGVACLCMAGMRIGLLADAVISGLCGLIFGMSAVYWTVSLGLGLNHLLYLVFGGMLLSSAFHAWTAYRAELGTSSGGGGAGVGWLGAWSRRRKPASEPVDEVELVHPASVHPESLPKEGEAPPAEGYLAALAKEKEEPPRAGYE